MITSIAIENFKGIADRVELDLRPITLLFGPNSSGKSTITDAMDYLEAILRARSANPADLVAIDQTSGRQEMTFNHLIHNHDLSRMMTLGVTCRLEESDRDAFAITRSPKGIAGTPSKFSHAEQHSIDYDGTPFRIELQILNRVLDACETPVAYPVIVKLRISYALEKLVDICLHDGNQVGLACFRWTVNLSNPILESDMGGISSLEFDNYDVSPLPRATDPPLRAGFYRECDSRQKIPSPAVASQLNALIQGASRVACHRLADRKALAGIRAVPDRTSTLVVHSEKQRWRSGLGAWDYLALCDEEQLEEVNHWLGETRLNTGYRVTRRHLIDVEKAKRILASSDQPEPIKHASDLLDTITPEIHRVALIHDGEPRVGDQPQPILYPRDVGTGISQVVPVLVAALGEESCLNCIAQPELHLHPRLQAELADLFLEHPKHYLIETHSEQLILRLLRRIREAFKHKLHPMIPLMTDQISVYFFHRVAGATNIKQIDIDENGEFIQPWPDDFFEINFYERFPNAE